MINGTSVISAVCRKIHAAFPEVPIYREHIGENFDEPSFFVWTSNVTPITLQHPHFALSHQIEVNYFPSHSDVNMYEHMLDVAVQLIECLNFVELVEGKQIVWGMSPDYKIIDNNLLQYSVEYRVDAIINQTKSPNMAVLDSYINSKH